MEEETPVNPVYAAVPYGVTTENVLDAFGALKTVILDEFGLEDQIVTIKPRTAEDAKNLLSMGTAKFFDTEITFCDNLEAAKAKKGAMKGPQFKTAHQKSNKSASSMGNHRTTTK
mmetsp:Transcript_514/g.614  ORF Transcript_514/g.614 Transcript_514/m.614 type:complete len:115 (-) Transcript_514:1165-1509(-)